MSKITIQSLENLDESVAVVQQGIYVFCIESSGFDSYCAAIYRRSGDALKFLKEDYESTYPTIEAALAWCTQQV